jgi:tetratricopeptide (TPR) repeat protein
MHRILKVAGVVACVAWSLMAGSTEHNATTLSADARSSNLSELFSKVLELEEKMRELTGKLQVAEHEQQTLLNKFNQVIKAKDEASHAHSQIKDRANTETQSPSFDKGEILYSQGLAAYNNKLYSQAATYFAKSYRYYSEVKSNEVLFKLIEVLALEKKYEQACTLTKKISDKRLKAEQKSYLTELIFTHCQKKSQGEG